MKKNFLWMLAAILLCGTMTTVFTACGDDDDDDSPSSSSNTYEVTLSGVLPRCSAPYMQLKVDYTDADGKSETMYVKEGDQSQDISEDAMDIYKNATSAYRGKPDYVTILDNIIVRNITLRVPAGKSFSFKGTIVVRNDYATPTSDVSVVQPCVISTAKRISGNSNDRSELATNGSLSVIASFGIDAESFATIMNRWNGRDAGIGGATMK
jgi:hypothetical protein